MKNLPDDRLAEDGGIKRCFTAMRRNLRHWKLKGRAISSAGEWPPSKTAMEINVYLYGGIREEAASF